tara:strand:- start:3038 stop:4960 length:1923 start_codon:yes stop_codon:yes gene_type:complete
MALIDLKSDLSWYGKKNPGPYKTNADRNDTKYTDKDGVPSTTTGGYEPQGVAHLTPIERFAGDAFQIDDISFSDRGTASRKAQLGVGSKFPIGPEGQVHSFDEVRIGFTNSAKYGEVYSNLSNKGLANTYTAKSPIDDQYNKLNLRDDATPNWGLVKQPFILRGIQRKDNSKPQRWGLSNTVAGRIDAAFDLPRGGILTNVERTLVDVLRIGKFLISPKGLGFITKQVGYQLMNPVTSTRLWNPLSLGSIAPMVHINRHVGGGFLEKKLPKLLGALGGGLDLQESRLLKLLEDDRDTKELTIGKLVSGDKWKTLSQKIGGPGSILGIGGTDYFKYSDTNFQQQKETGLSLDTWQTDGDGYHRWGYGILNYEKTRGEGGVKSAEDVDGRDGLKTRHEGEWPIISPDRGGRGTSLPGGGIPVHTEGPIIDDYRRMAYGDMPTRIPPKGNKDARQTTHIDFRDSGQSQALKIGWDGDRKIDEIDAIVDEGLIKFSIGGVKFKAYLGSLNDNFAGSWGGQADQGRADQRYLYESFERTISTDFLVPIYTKDDRATIWGNLQKLAQKTYPVYKSSGFHGQTVKVTIGDMFKNKDMIITDLSYDWDNETPWEITDGNQAPMYTNVSVSFTVLGSKPTSGTTVYSNI